MSTSGSDKSPAAFRTIGEVSRELGVPQHVLRYWEGRFPELRPLTRAGNRRYYRPEDVALVQRINVLLNREGYTIRGVQQVLAARDSGDSASSDAAPVIDIAALRTLRDRLSRALAEDAS